jgi:hypothetical protein
MREVSDHAVVEKLRMGVDIVGVVAFSRTISFVLVSYAAPKRTETSFDTPGSCMVTP